MAFGGTTKFKDIQAAHDTASSTHATAVVVHELDGLAITLAACLEVARLFRELLTVPHGHVKSEEASKAEYELRLFPDVRLFLLCTCRHRLAGG